MPKPPASNPTRAVFADALRAGEQQKPLVDPPPTAKRGGFEAGKWPGAPYERLPPECPVLPLGIEGKVVWLIDSVGQLQGLAINEWGKKAIVHLFASCPNYTQWAWPKWNAKTLTISGVEVDDAVACLTKHAAARGLFEPADRVRGRGGWVDGKGRFLWHSGDRIWRVDNGRLREALPAEIDEVFYPRRPAIEHPWQEPVAQGAAELVGLLEDLRSWEWERPALDPILFAGWMVCAYAGGALDWRPGVFVTGDAGVGKSTMQHVVKEVLGRVLFKTGDTTEAGITQLVGIDSLPVAVDELEAEADNKKVVAVVKLAQIAASGDWKFRGGQDHQGHRFRMVSAFCFGAINPPPMDGAKRSRLAILNLKPLDRAKVRQRVLRDGGVIGRMMLRRLMDGWGEWPATLEKWRTLLRERAFSQRAQDTYGTLLAAAELVLGEEALEAAGLPIAEDSLADFLAAATHEERAGNVANWRGCIAHVLESMVEGWKGGERPIVGQALEDLDQGLTGATDAAGLATVRRQLGALGLGVIDGRERDKAGVPKYPGSEGYLLAIPAASPLTAKAFNGTRWADGVWAGALRQAPETVVIRDRGNAQVVWINGKSTRCLLVDLKAYAQASEEG